MAIKCENFEMLCEFVRKKYPDAEFTHPTGIQTKVTFPNGLVMNMYTTTGSVNFQGNSYQNNIAEDIKKYY